MCKIFAMTNMTNVKVTQEFLGIVRDAVCKTVDNDGFGYAVSNSQGQLWGERALNPMDFEALKPTSRTKQLPIIQAPSDAFGPVGSDDNRAFIAHGRMSTNDVSLANTHPFINDNVALIHNGVVSDPDLVTQGELKTTCDTEILLRLWEKEEIDSIEEHAAGYYAIAALDTNGQLHIVRDDRAQLHVVYSPTIDSYLFATTVEILNDIALRMNWTIETPELVMGNTYAVFESNEVTYHREIFPRGYEYSINNAKVSAALGENYLSSDYSDTQKALDDDYSDDWSGLSEDDGPCDDIPMRDVVEMFKKRKLA